MKPKDLITMKELGELVGKSKGAIYQWKRAYSFPFKVYRGIDGLDSVSKAAVKDWMTENGMKPKKTSTSAKTTKTTTGKKRVAAAARRAVVKDTVETKPRAGVELEEDRERPTIRLPLSDDFTIQFWSRVVDAMELQRESLTLTYENGTAVLIQNGE